MKEHVEGEIIPERIAIRLIIEEIKAASQSRPELALGLKSIIWGGSRGLEENKLIGNQTSDLDVVTICAPHKDNDPVNLECLETLNTAFRNASQRLMEMGLIPVVIATIRLEEAEIAMAEMLHPHQRILPIHWLFYPSVEFGLVNEPPDLFRNLVQGEILEGNHEFLQTLTEKVRQGNVSRETTALLEGLDWLTDTFRIFEVNNLGQLPRNFLVRLATHNLEYFLKWRVVVRTIENQTGQEVKTWKQITEFQSLFPFAIWNLCQKAKVEREKGTWAQEETIRSLFKETFRRWPEIVSLRESK